MLAKFIGPLLVAVAAILWGTDALFRLPTSESLDPTFIVFTEHLLGVIALTPFVLRRHRGDLFKLGLKAWLSVLFIGAGGSAIATVLFTASFRYLNPSVTILLQKLQPIVVILLAHAFLREKPAAKFYAWAAIALGAAVVLSFPDLNFRFLAESGNLHARGVGYALAAAALWAASTVAGRVLLNRTAPLTATFWRYIFGLGTLAFLLVAAGIPVSWAQVSPRPILTALLYLSLISGVIPMFTYYAGLARTPASVTTFVELLYPISAVILNWIVLRTPLDTTQTVAGGVLLFAVTMISV